MFHEFQRFRKIRWKALVSDSVFIKVVGLQHVTFLQHETPQHLFSCECCQNFQNSIFAEHPLSQLLSIKQIYFWTQCLQINFKNKSKTMKNVEISSVKKKKKKQVVIYIRTWILNNNNEASEIVSKSYTERISARAPFLLNWQARVCNFVKKESLTQLLSCEFCQIFKNTFFYWTPSVATSVIYYLN